MSAHVFAFACPHCATTISHRGELRQGVAACRNCGAEYRIDVKVATLHGPLLRSTPTDAVCANPNAPGRPLIAALMEVA